MPPLYLTFECSGTGPPAPCRTMRPISLPSFLSSAEIDTLVCRGGNGVSHGPLVFVSGGVLNKGS